MPLCSRAACVALAFLASYASAATDPGVQLVGRGLVAGDALDLSGLAGARICAKDDAQNCIDQATLGGFGSAIAYTGHDGVLIATPDRGPFDGRTNVPLSRPFHFLHLAVDTSVNPASGQTNITTTLLDTRFLKSEANKNFVGDAYGFNAVNPLAALRFDPEGLSIGRDGTFFVSDEYGPYINEFNREGHLVRRIPVPAKFLIAHPTGDVDSGGNSFELYPTKRQSAVRRETIPAARRTAEWRVSPLRRTAATSSASCRMR